MSDKTGSLSVPHYGATIDFDFVQQPDGIEVTVTYRISDLESKSIPLQYRWNSIAQDWVIQRQSHSDFVMSGFMKEWMIFKNPGFKSEVSKMLGKYLELRDHMELVFDLFTGNLIFTIGDFISDMMFELPLTWYRRLTRSVRRILYPHVL